MWYINLQLQQSTLQSWFPHVVKGFGNVSTNYDALLSVSLGNDNIFVYCSNCLLCAFPFSGTILVNMKEIAFFNLARNASVDNLKYLPFSVFLSFCGCAAFFLLVEGEVGREEGMDR